MNGLLVPDALLKRAPSRLLGSILRYYALVLIEPGISYEAAAQRLGLSLPSVYRLEKELRLAGILEVSKTVGQEGTRLMRHVLQQPNLGSAQIAS